MTANRGNRRQARAAENLRAELSRLLLTAVQDPRLAWVTITGVDASPDLRYARVFFVATGVSDQQEVSQSLAKAAPFLQREMGRSLKLRFTPKLVFLHDESFDSGSRIDNLLDSINEQAAVQRANESDSQTLARLVDESTSIMLATHHNPDGDAIGSLLGMSAILSSMGKKHVAYCPDDLPLMLTFLPGVSDLCRYLDSDFRCDLTIVLDTADQSLLPRGFPGADVRGHLVVIDHHLRHGELGDLVIRREASAVGEILFELARELAWQIDANAAECLYTSIVADTGSFRYESTTPRTHRVAAELISAGAMPWRVASALFESYPVVRQRLMGRVIDTLALSDSGRFASLHCTPQMLADVGAHKSDLDGLINLGRSVAGVEISAMFRVDLSGDIKVSFRSRGRVDVGLLAARFGGGGHVNAAGCTLTGLSLDEAKEQISAIAREMLGTTDSIRPS